jgi:D-serine deaminase-like pyridoxal phosphate-dependent protein
MTERVGGKGVKLRPHMKTAKSMDVARIALDGNFGGITVSTLKEAEYFAGHGVKDILYAVGIVTAKLEEAAALMRRGVDLALITDDLDTATSVSARGRALGVRFRVLIEVDCGERRGGIAPTSELLVPIGRALHDDEGAELAGVLTHAGHSYACRSIAEVVALTEVERSVAATAADRLRAAGLPVGIVSMGSTPTALYGDSYAGITEVRAGVYMFGDLFQAEIASCGRGDIAVSVLSSVIGQRRADARILIDAGALALSKDRSTEATARDVGFGLVADESGEPSFGSLIVQRVNQEHGIVTASSALPFDRLPVGARVRVLPNHACLTAAAYDHYAVVDGGDEVVAFWPRVNGW